MAPRNIADRTVEEALHPLVHPAAIPAVARSIRAVLVAPAAGPTVVDPKRPIVVDRAAPVALPNRVGSVGQAAESMPEDTAAARRRNPVPFGQANIPVPTPVAGIGAQSSSEARSRGQTARPLSAADRRCDLSCGIF